MRRVRLATLLFAWAFTAGVVVGEEKSLIRLAGEIVDAETGQPLPARLYIQSSKGDWHCARSAADSGSAIEYRKARSSQSTEMHTTLSAHPFVADVPPGEYELVAERGKEYLPGVAKATLPNKDGKPLTIRLQRWVNMQQQGWYSGDTHVHRPLEELPNLLLAEDLNVALPLTQWVTRSHTAPTQGDKNSPDAAPKLIEVDPTHVIYPMNTEYEIFTVRDKRHTLGAVFALNHRRPLKLGAPPVGPIAEQVRREGGLLELDKHNWPWSMMLVPVMKVDLYELSNNHIWRTEFFFHQFGAAPPAFMKVEQDRRGMTEKGWIDFTLGNYYTLLNCGYRLRPTAGTASGVHPVPLGFGRVYVHVDGEFAYDKWIAGLDKGRSFVTTGPVLVTRVNGLLASATFKQDAKPQTYRVSGSAKSARRLSTVEIVAAGEVVRTLKPENRPLKNGGFESAFDETFTLDSSTWLAVRCWEPTADGRPRYAHSAPVFVDVKDRPLRPRREEIRYLIQRVEDELDRNRNVLDKDALSEYEAALSAYREIENAAR